MTSPAHLPRTAAVLGGGSVGTVLLPALRTAGVRVVAAWSRTALSPQWRSGPLPRALREAELVLLSVSDAGVAPLCAQLAAERLIGAGQLVAHLAGALDLTPLDPAVAAGARAGSLHPLRAIPPGSRADALSGAACGIDASDDTAREQLSLLAQALGMTPLSTSGDRGLYHAAAVLAGGGQVALFDEAARAFRAATGASEEEARAALLPLARSALDALAARATGAALTGPVVRADVETVRAHLAALVAHDWRAASLYQLLALSSLRLAREAGRLGPGELEALQGALGVGSDEAAAPPDGLAPPGPEVSFGGDRGASIGAHDHGHAGHAHGHQPLPAPEWAPESAKRAARHAAGGKPGKAAARTKPATARPAKAAAAKARAPAGKRAPAKRKPGARKR